MPSSKKSTAKTAKKRPAVKRANTPKIKSSRSKRLFTLIMANKLITALVLVVALLLGALVNQKYQDWDNAQMIKGLAEDFPALVADIEAATGLDLEVKYECMKTQEKFNDGVNTCELSTGFLGREGIGDDFITELEKSSNFISVIDSDSKDVRSSYRNKQSCSGWSAAKDRTYFKCQISIRRSNVKLANELFHK